MGWTNKWGRKGVREKGKEEIKGQKNGRTGVRKFVLTRIERKEEDMSDNKTDKCMGYERDKIQRQEQGDKSVRGIKERKEKFVLPIIFERSRANSIVIEK